MKRILMHLPDREGCGFNRATLPVKHCAPILKQENIILDIDENLSDYTYDAYIFHRTIRPQFLGVIQQLQAEGKKVCWAIDDDLWNVPEWNPASKSIRQEHIDCINWVKDHADQILVSTEPLKEVVGLPEKTTVLPNLIDLELWKGLPKENHDEVRIMWAGSNTHLGDLEAITPAIERLLDDYGDRLLFLFMGDLPDSMAEFVRIKYSHLGMMVPANKYDGRVGLVRSVPLDQYPETLLSLEADIAIAPLADVPFNYSKSNLKYLEYSVAGLPTVASGLPPYQDTGAVLVDAILTSNDPLKGITIWDDWYKAIKNLIDHKQVRDVLGRSAQMSVMAGWSWQSYKKELWLQWFRKLVQC